jgi:hypothetical protein
MPSKAVGAAFATSSIKSTTASFKTVQKQPRPPAGELTEAALNIALRIATRQRRDGQ